MSPFQQHYGGGDWLASRADTGPMMMNRTGNGFRNGFFQAATNATFPASNFVNQFRFAAARSIRTSTIILAVFNTIAAFATAVGILLDAYYRERRNNKKYRFGYGNDMTPRHDLAVTDCVLAATALASSQLPRSIRLSYRSASWSRASHLPSLSQLALTLFSASDARCLPN